MELLEQKTFQLKFINTVLGRVFPNKSPSRRGPLSIGQNTLRKSETPNKLNTLWLELLTFAICSWRLLSSLLTADQGCTLWTKVGSSSVWVVWPFRMAGFTERVLTGVFWLKVDVLGSESNWRALVFPARWLSSAARDSASWRWVCCWAVRVLEACSALAALKTIDLGRVAEVDWGALKWSLHKRSASKANVLTKFGRRLIAFGISNWKRKQTLLRREFEEVSFINSHTPNFKIIQGGGSFAQPKSSDAF